MSQGMSMGMTQQSQLETQESQFTQSQTQFTQTQYTQASQSQSQFTQNDQYHSQMSQSQTQNAHEYDQTQPTQPQDDSLYTAGQNDDQYDSLSLSGLSFTGMSQEGYDENAKWGA